MVWPSSHTHSTNDTGPHAPFAQIHHLHGQRIRPHIDVSDLHTEKFVKIFRLRTRRVLQRNNKFSQKKEEDLNVLVLLESSCVRRHLLVRSSSASCYVFDAVCSQQRRCTCHREGRSTSLLLPSWSQVFACLMSVQVLVDVHWNIKDHVAVNSKVNVHSNVSVHVCLSVCGRKVRQR